LADTRLKIAVFIDFDNIEIGVKSTLNVAFDIGVVLEALKERGDVVSKTAYGDWTRAGDYSRSLTQHATKLVQRNLTPGGDKNGADINLALDALEMAFTHGHINAYVIVGGDSDFISLVEKLKQYDKQIFVVGGRAFTSLVMQRNCHEFIAYENLVGSRRFQDRGQRSAPVSVGQASLDQVVPLVRRALKVLADREVTPQLGLLKSTLLQLDSTFSERTYGAGSFRDFAQKLAAAGHVSLRESGRNVLVEWSESGPVAVDESAPRAEVQPAREPAPAPAPAPTEGAGRAADGIREIRRMLLTSPKPPRWPMYIRQLKQFLRNVDASFDERRYGFETLGDLMRACQREGLLRIERDRQGGMRIFPGNIAQAVPAPVESSYAEPSYAEPSYEEASERQPEAAASTDVVEDGWAPQVDAATRDDGDVVDGNVVQEREIPPIVDAVEAPEPEKPARRRRSAAPRGNRAGGEPRSRKPADGAAAPASRSRKTPSKPRSPRGRTRNDASNE
jgi:uncharacterized LabA/DUF88 family protein